VQHRVLVEPPIAHPATRARLRPPSLVNVRSGGREPLGGPSRIAARPSLPPAARQPVGHADLPGIPRAARQIRPSRLGNRRPSLCAGRWPITAQVAGRWVEKESPLDGSSPITRRGTSPCRTLVPRSGRRQSVQAAEPLAPWPARGSSIVPGNQSESAPAGFGPRQTPPINCAGKTVLCRSRPKPSLPHPSLVRGSSPLRGRRHRFFADISWSGLRKNLAARDRPGNTILQTAGAQGDATF